MGMDRLDEDGRPWKLLQSPYLRHIGQLHDDSLIRKENIEPMMATRLASLEQLS